MDPTKQPSEVYDLRCGYINYARLPLPDDAFERHWRCPATFPYEPGTIYCQRHSSLHYPGEPATPEEISDAFAEALAANPDSTFLQAVCAERARRLAAGELPVQAALQALTSVIAAQMPDASNPVTGGTV